MDESLRTEKTRAQEPLEPEVLKKRLPGSIFSSFIHYAPCMDSTNALAKSLAGQGAPEGTLVITEEQTAGRGRRGRSWFSPPGANLLFSVLLRPPMPGDRVFTLTMILALAALGALKEQIGLSVGIKWPNDLYVGPRKLAGILTEFSVKEKQVDWAVLGMGLNVGWHPEVPQGSGALATSLLVETGRPVPRNELLVQILLGLEGFYRQILTGESGTLYREWNRHCLILGREVTLESNGEKSTGKAIRIDEDGALVIEIPSGEERRVVCGDVSLRLES